MGSSFLFHHRGTESAKKSFCFSGDTEKQKGSALKTKNNPDQRADQKEAIFAYRGWQAG